MAVLVVLGILAATAALVPGGLAAATQPAVRADPLPAAYLATNLLIGLLAAILGGWLATRLAPAAPHKHVLALAGLVVLMALVTARTQGPDASAQPPWYPWATAAIGLAGVLLGGHLHTRASPTQPRLA
jgi:hypothetical protein